MSARPVLAFTSQPGRMTAADHRRRLEASDLYQRRELDTERAKQWSRVKALLYLSADYVEQWPDFTPMGGHSDEPRDAREALVSDSCARYFNSRTALDSIEARTRTRFRTWNRFTTGHRMVV